MSFPRVALGDILTPVSRPESVDSEKEYRILGAHWYAEGLYIKDIKLGAEIQANKVYRIEKGDFVYNRLFAWKGSFAVATDENHGCYVSNEFPCFNVNSDRADSKYLWLYFSRTKIWEEALGLSTGGTPTSRNRLKEGKFLAMQISLPPLTDQSRIVARIEELAAKIQEVRGLRKKAGEEVEALLRSALHQQFNSTQIADIPKQPIATLATIFRGRSPVYQEGSGKLAINQKCVRWNGIDIVHAKEVSEGWIQSLPSNSFLQENDILVNSTGEGTIGRACILTQNALGFPFDSHVLVVRVEKDKVLPTLIAYYLRSPCGQEAIEDSKGAKTTKQTELGTTKLGEIIIPIPSLPEQHRIVAYLDELQAKVDTLRRLQKETGAEMDALMPAVLDRAFKGEL